MRIDLTHLGPGHIVQNLTEVVGWGGVEVLDEVGP